MSAALPHENRVGFMGLREIRCQEKTARRNVFGTEEQAERAARNMNAKLGTDEIQAFACECCRFWHIGSRRPHG